MAASGYETGFSVFSYEWMAAVVLIIFAIFFLPRYFTPKYLPCPSFWRKDLTRVPDTTIQLSPS